MLRGDEPCLLEKLKTNGYEVWWGGKNDLVPAQFGYERFCDNPVPQHAADGAGDAWDGDEVAGFAGLLLDVPGQA